MEAANFTNTMIQWVSIVNCMNTISNVLYTESLMETDHHQLPVVNALNYFVEKVKENCDLGEATIDLKSMSQIINMITRNNDLLISEEHRRKRSSSQGARNTGKILNAMYKTSQFKDGHDTASASASAINQNKHLQRLLVPTKQPSVNYAQDANRQFNSKNNINRNSLHYFVVMRALI